MVLDGSAETDEPIGADMARVGHSASPGPKQPGREHKLAELGPLTYCQVCGCYGDSVNRGLLKPCDGKPSTNSNVDKCRRRKRRLLMQGRHPGTMLPVEGAVPGQPAKRSRCDQEPPAPIPPDKMLKGVVGIAGGYSDHPPLLVGS